MKDEMNIKEDAVLSEGEHRDAPLVLPVIPLRGTVAFPSVQLTLEIARGSSLKAFAAAAASNRPEILLFAQKDDSVDEPKPGDLSRVGVLAAIRHVVKTPQGSLSVLFEGISRVQLLSCAEQDDFLVAQAVEKEEPAVRLGDSPLTDAMVQEVLLQLKRLPDIHPVFTEEMRQAACAMTELSALADFVASSALLNCKNKQTVLEAFRLKRRFEKLLVALGEERMILECEHDIQSQVKEKIDRHQKDYFLREQVKAIQAELGEDDDDEIREYDERIAEAHLPKEVEEKLYKELGKLAKTPYGAAEGTVMRNYLDTCLDFPFTHHTQAHATVAEARRILDADHDGLEKVKELILEFVAVKEFSPDIKNQILCLVGPPGVGKTSVAASIARALGRKYARISLGGLHDEAEIRGHRKTYVGAMPGRIVSALIAAKVNNPVIVLDEIDKIAKDFRGDPTSALLEVLDPEQNKAFRDNFMEMPIDLSDCLFIATANSYEGIPLPLLDRMEVIELPTYTDSEKLAIAKNHLFPKQLKRNGMTRRQVKLTDDALLGLIRRYTKEAGVRSLEREIASLIRKSAKKIAEGECRSVTVRDADLETLLGKQKIHPERPEESDPVGIVNGLAYTQAGGDLLKVEVAVMEGNGKIELTGSLGDVMKESAHIAHSYVRTVAERYRIAPDFYKTKDLHIHFPEGAIPKDGPSAGVTMVTAIVSALGKIPVRREVAMTGEITLCGKVLPIGGLREKTLAAYRSGIETVLLPAENLADLDEVDSEAREHLTFIPCKTADDILKNALRPLPRS